MKNTDFYIDLLKRKPKKEKVSHNKENLSGRAIMYGRILSPLDEKARSFIMRPRVNAPNIRFNKMGWVSSVDLTENQKRISTTGYVKFKTGEALVQL